MFNVHLFEKKLKIKNDVERQKDDFIKGQSKRKGYHLICHAFRFLKFSMESTINDISTLTITQTDKQNELAANYKKRVENFVINMLENPIVTQEYKGPTAYKIRDEHPEKFLKDPQVYIKGFKHEKDRIRESCERNQDLDYMPNQTVAHYQFRDREVDKEIQPDMRFTAKTSLERIEQFLKDHMQTQVENIDFRDKKKQKKFTENFPEYQTPWERRRLLAKEIAKNLLPSLHNKTHFSAAQSLYNSCPVSLCDKQTRSQPNLMPKIDPQADQQDSEDKDANKKAKQQKSKSKDPKQYNEQNNESEQGDKKNLRRSFEDTKVKAKDQKVDQMEAFNPIETSKKVLQLCNVIKKKNLKVKYVGKGQGHLICTLDKSISDVYHELYNKSIQFPSIYS